jgi:(2R)-3-sulfolactate dehydrogenase (NADP+)
MRVPHYLRRLMAGGYPPTAELREVRDTGPLVILDGGGGLGHGQLWKAAELAASRCGEHGISAVGVGNSGHAGALGVYTLPVLELGHVGLVLSCGPAAMPAWQGSSPVLSTSPLAAGIPCSPRPAIIDMASTTVARGRIAEHAARSEELPLGWALDSEGEPTTDPARALVGMLAPFGGAKGFALAFVIEALTAGLVGPLLSRDIPDVFSETQSSAPQQIAHLVIALDPTKTDSGGDPSVVRARFDQLARSIVDSGARIPGARRINPDELDEDETTSLAPAVLGQMRDWANRLGVQW